MLFNSIEFALFLPIVFIIYWFVVNKNLKAQNILILIASYIFYGWWNWKFLFLIVFSTVVDFFIGQYIYKLDNKKQRKLLLSLSILVNLGFLGIFKYYNFFIENFVSAFKFFGHELSVNSLNLILPVGISFYTFQTMSYTIDVYKDKLKPTKDFIAFSAFVSFFPQLVAGPIERAKNLLPQFYTKRSFDYNKATDGMRQILWGLFKKVVIADNCADHVNRIFEHSAEMPSGLLVIGALFFTFQIYCDFSGYSDIAIGTSRLFGFNLMKNFAFPYFSRDIAEFWRRWHISLSTWFRDYLYIPLGGSRGSKLIQIRNIFIIFIVSGFWHGANWTFIIWGALNAVFFLPLMLLNKNRKNLNVVANDSFFPNFKDFISIFFTFILTMFTWIFFRATSVKQAINYIINIFSPTIFNLKSEYLRGVSIHRDTLLILILFFIIIEWTGRKSEFAIAKLGLKWNTYVRYAFYYIILITIFWYGGKEQQFIYFQF